MKTTISDLDILPAPGAAEGEETTCDAPRVLHETAGHRKLYIESYGCQMNFSDSEIVASILGTHGYGTTASHLTADVVLLNTCAIRDNAEQKIRHRLRQFQTLKRDRPEVVVGVLGCMAERLKTQLLDEERIVDLVVGPDAYRDLPRLLGEVEEGQRAVNVFLSREETYADVNPVRLHSNGVTAFISIMRGCDNMCSFCVVPYTRGRERSRDPHTVVEEARRLFAAGYREVTLLGQNVDSYKWQRPDGDERVNFAALLARVAAVAPALRVRFSTSHPKDITDEVLHVMAAHANVCNYIHLPVQSGSSEVLRRMNRTYDRDWYLERVGSIRRILGEDCGISSDMIAGFCSETEEQHQQTLSLMAAVRYDFAYMFYYSERPGTPAARKLSDDVPLEVKKRRLQEIIARQRIHALARNQRHLGRTERVLIEGFSKRSEQQLRGRNDENVTVVFDRHHYRPGQYVRVRIADCTAATLLGEVVGTDEPT